ncbi:MAG: DUF1015 domain-containing protein [Bryobacterales bacterium]|nr:DUF1015 domain-containing protein [Bryobacterales bacterium]
MAKVFPFQAYRYTPKAGDPANLVTQPYDKIYPAMRDRYLAVSPYNLVRIVLGETHVGDSESHNVYTRAAGYLDSWIADGALAQDAEPSMFAYYQEFEVPGTGEWVTRKGLIALGALEEYANGVVYRHEQTLSGPKKDRMELLRHTRAHLEQLFLIYQDEAGDVDRMLDEASAGAPELAVTDEYGARHSLWRVSDAAAVGRIQTLMSDKKLIIADGHHRYETALAFAKEHADLAGADRVVMTLVNMHSPGLRILATHRVMSGLPAFDLDAFLARVEGFAVTELAGLDHLKRAWEEGEGRVIIGVASGRKLYMLDGGPAAGRLDVSVLHESLIQGALGVTAEEVREQKNIHYVRGLDAAHEEVRSGIAQIGFLLKATSLDQVAEVSFGGGVMPQKSTDFYPKLLSGLTVYKF